MNTTSDTLAAAKAVILVLAEIKSATAAFDRGEANAFDALDRIEIAIDAHRHATQLRRDAA